jgi:hypothetical protein
MRRTIRPHSVISRGFEPRDPLATVLRADSEYRSPTLAPMSGRSMLTCTPRASSRLFERRLLDPLPPHQPSSTRPLAPRDRLSYRLTSGRCVRDSGPTGSCIGDLDHRWGEDG